MNIVKRSFRPELLNRLQAIVVFNNLGKSQLREIVRHLVKEVQQRLVERQITLDVDDGACDLVLEQSYDPEYGARPLRRFVENVIVTDLSKKILDGKLIGSFFFPFFFCLVCILTSKHPLRHGYVRE